MRPQLLYILRNAAVLPPKKASPSKSGALLFLRPVHVVQRRVNTRQDAPINAAAFVSVCIRGGTNYACDPWSSLRRAGHFFCLFSGATMTDYIIERLKEASTWRGIVLVFTSFGLQISPEQSAAIMSLGLGIAGAIGALLPNKAGE